MADKADKANQPIIVRSYKQVRQYEQDAQLLAAHGYRVVSVTEQLQRYPWWQVLSTGSA